MSGLRASSKGGDSKRIENVELIPTGFQLCTLYGLADIGTQDNGNFGPRHKVNMCFEFPQHMRVFYEGDDPKPSCIFVFETLSMHEKSNLRTRFVQPMAGGKKMTDDEADEFDISSLLGKHFVATIAHSPDGKWANIQSITPLNEQNKAMFGLQSTAVEQINETFFFSLDLGFNSNNFATLPKFVRESLINSEEGKAHKLSGGVFAEPQEGATAPQGTGGNAAPKGKFVMIDQTTTYEAYIEAGWTEEQMIENGIAKRLVATPPPAPVGGAPTPPPPAPNKVLPPPPVKKEPVLVMNDPTAVLADWLAQGWTEQDLVDNGHATFQ